LMAGAIVVLLNVAGKSNDLIAWLAHSGSTWLFADATAETVVAARARMSTALHVVTMQALSGAGYPGVPSLDSLANVIPHIGGEEDKMAAEPLKILGTLGPDGVENATFTVSAQCNRVPVLDGHLLCVSVKLRGNPSADDARETLRNAPDPLADLGLPTSPERCTRPTTRSTRRRASR